MRFSLTGSTNLTWDEIREAAGLAEELGFDAFYANDHLRAGPGFDAERGTLDASSVIAALGPITRSIRLGCLVSPVTVRHPVLLARVAQTLDRITGGRVEIGLGAGWDAPEHRSFGFAFPSATSRVAMLDDACRAISGLWRGPVDIEGRFPLSGARLTPRPVQAEAPIVVGGASDATVDVAARWAVRWNASGSPGFLAGRVAALRHGEEQAGRPVGSVEATAMVCVHFCSTDADVDAARNRARSLSTRGQARSWADGEDPAESAFVGRPGELAGYLDRVRAAGIERAILSLPRPWSPDRLTQLAVAAGMTVAV